MYNTNILKKKKVLTDKFDDTLCFIPPETIIKYQYRQSVAAPCNLNNALSGLIAIKSPVHWNI